MKTNIIPFAMALGMSVVTSGNINAQEISDTDGGHMVGVSAEQRSGHLDRKKEQRARMMELKRDRREMRAKAKEARRIGRQADAAAKEATHSYKAEKKAQKARRHADRRALKAAKAKRKSEANQ